MPPNQSLRRPRQVSLCVRRREHMAKKQRNLKTVDTAEARRQIAQRVANVFPGCTAQFVDGRKAGSLAFRIQDSHGRVRSNLVTIYTARCLPVTKSWLKRAVKFAKRPRADFPHLKCDA
jgi:hypothetical protein